MDRESSKQPDDKAPSTHSEGLQPSASFVAEQQEQEKVSASPAPAAQPSSVYPDPGKKADWQPLKSPEIRDEEYRQASYDMNDMITAIAGVASAVSYLIIIYYAKSTSATAVVGVALAAVSLFYAFRNYQASGRMTPLTVIGLCAATTTLIYVANMLIAQAIVRSALNGMY